MIKGLQGSKYITVLGGNTSVPYVNQNPNNPMQGVIRVWGSDMQVFDGNNWMTISTSYATVEVDHDTQRMLEWVKTKKLEEEMLPVLTSDHPAVRLAKQNLNKAKEEVKHLEEQLKITTILARDDDPELVQAGQ
jgi:protein subunit release factor A